LTDPQGKSLAGATLRLVSGRNSNSVESVSDPEGRFVFHSLAEGSYSLSATSPEFAEVHQAFQVAAGQSLQLDLQFSRLNSRIDTVNVIAGVKDIDVQSPDPAEKVFASEDLLDANPGRPGAPISIPGYPIETASSGIKAPQYFAPGVAGDHGELIAQFIQVGSYLVPNNLSANGAEEPGKLQFLVFTQLPDVVQRDQRGVRLVLLPGVDRVWILRPAVGGIHRIESVNRAEPGHVGEAVVSDSEQRQGVISFTEDLAATAGATAPPCFTFAKRPASAPKH
jgi:hypothetical protein